MGHPMNRSDTALRYGPQIALIWLLETAVLLALLGTGFVLPEIIRAVVEVL
jgi:hypothetical protein